ncbi:MAG: response regulator [Ignavibacteria bacterium]|nr:response regulator [Ignavibacteria bacterium]
MTKPNGNKDKFNQSINAVVQTISRGKALVQQLLTFARKTEVLFEPIEVNNIVREVAKMVEATFPKTITFRQQLASPMPTISADSNQLHQSLLNLCVNARDAMPSGGTLCIETEIVYGHVLRKRFHEAREEQYVCISVSDTGIGMDSATRVRIFEPFFTTKDKGKGTGLGLAVAYGIIKSHHGFIDVESEQGRGTTFRLYFGVPVKEVKSHRLTRHETEENLSGDETILLVEDEEMLLEAVRDLLKEQGYSVLTAYDGEEAIELYEREWKNVSLVVSDMGLPKRGGWDVYLKMKEINPHVRAIFASGNIDPEKKVEMAKQGVGNFVQKPYLINDVLRQIRKVLDNQQN